MFGVLKCGVPESARFYIGDLPMYTFLVQTHPFIECDKIVVTLSPLYVCQ